MNAPSCIYCGGKDLTREHFVPKSLGGTRSAKFACAKCNNGFLSQLDNELAGRSPLSLVAADELRQWFRNSWDVDYANGNLLLEGHADSRNRSLTLWPQIVFDDDGPHTYGDNEEIERFGRERFLAVFFQHLLSAFQTLSEKRPRFIAERVLVPAGPYRFPPRVFAARPIREFNNKMHFQCRYVRESDKRKACAFLADWHLPRRSSVEVRPGSTCPPLRVTYDCLLVLRALIKLGLNLVRCACERTTVHRANFSDTIRLVTGESPIRRHVTTKCGFVYAEDIGQLGCPPSSHKFRLLHDRGLWVVYCAFFSGRAGACVQFPGPSQEVWRTLDITAPIGCRDWSMRPSNILLPVRARIEWNDLRKIIPSVPVTWEGGAQHKARSDRGLGEPCDGE
jgi:hypothetical protein